MKAFKKIVTMPENGELKLSDLPFKEGQKIEVLIFSEDKKNTINELKQLFKETQTQPSIQSISEEDIQKEIDLYRSTI